MSDYSLGFLVQYKPTIMYVTLSSMVLLSSGNILTFLTLCKNRLTCYGHFQNILSFVSAVAMLICFLCFFHTKVCVVYDIE